MSSVRISSVLLVALLAVGFSFPLVLAQQKSADKKIANSKLALKLNKGQTLRYEAQRANVAKGDQRPQSWSYEIEVLGNTGELCPVRVSITQPNADSAAKDSAPTKPRVFEAKIAPDGSIRGLDPAARKDEQIVSALEFIFGTGLHDEALTEGATLRLGDRSKAAARTARYLRVEGVDTGKMLVEFSVLARAAIEGSIEPASDKAGDAAKQPRVATLGTAQYDLRNGLLNRTVIRDADASAKDAARSTFTIRRVTDAPKKVSPDQQP